MFIAGLEGSLARGGRFARRWWQWCGRSSSGALGEARARARASWW